jgi:hypothetical protein
VGAGSPWPLQGSLLYPKTKKNHLPNVNPTVYTILHTTHLHIAI